MPVLEWAAARTVTGDSRLNASMPLLLDFARDPTGTLTRIAREQGDVAFFRFGRVDEVLVSHPELVEQVLVADQRAFAKGRALGETRRLLGDGLLTSEGRTHLDHRRIIQPLFHARAIGQYATAMVDMTERVVAGWRPGSIIDLHHELMRITLGIVGRTVFALDVDAHTTRVGRALDDAIGILSNRIANPFGEYLYRLPLPATRRFARARDELDETIAQLIAARRAAGLGGHDLLSLLLAAAEDDEQTADRWVRDEALTILLAGHETTAVWLAWTAMLLALHPHWQRAVAAEVDAVAGSRPVGLDDLPHLAALDQVLHEALRLYPPAWLIGRRAVAPIVLGGRTVPIGTIVVASQWVVHRDPRWYPEPDRFEPRRWEPAARASRPAFAFFPFGAGVRRCIGEGFAWMEAKLVLATLLSRHTFALRDGATRRPLPRITLRPRGGLPVVVQAR